MKTLTHLLVIAVFFLSLMTLAACGKDTVAPYVAPGTSGDVPEATDIQYTSPEYSDEMSPSEESLDSAEETDDQDSSQYGSSMDENGTTGDQASDEYKKTYGRSSEELLPIYFDFDQASIRNDQFFRLEQNADYLKNNSSAKVIIQGNCDERGTNEYNLALAERRALNAKTYFIELGIDEYRIRTVSYGEEQPLFNEQDEFSWAQNRRDDFILE
jgi:peptidoglycan-associated lipoprotein